jgi:hypothetical protein
MARWRRRLAEVALAVIVIGFLAAGAAFTASALLQPPQAAAAPSAPTIPATTWSTGPAEPSGVDELVAGAPSGATLRTVSGSQGGGPRRSSTVVRVAAHAGEGGAKVQAGGDARSGTGSGH